MNHIPLTQLDVKGDSIGLNRIETPKGERLEIETPTSSIRLDAVALEALAWQNHDTLANLSGADATHRSPIREDDSAERTQLTTVSNEFGFVTVYEMNTESGARIVLNAEKQGEVIRLFPTELETLAQQDHNLITRWLRSDLND
ncbi:hypothetical protein ACOZ4B_20280 (plasmid) [Haloferax prahovense]|uniref:hypothetical protein n=1 Tax=Haloferax prahovense TaxID=381852 RepID=UPI003C7172E8